LIQSGLAPRNPCNSPRSRGPMPDCRQRGLK
jgi:hypothetical protein